MQEENRQRESGRGHYEEPAALQVLNVFMQYPVEVCDLGVQEGAAHHLWGNERPGGHSGGFARFWSS
jgi:hypothetical protein